MRYFILRGHEPVESDFTEWRTHDDHLVAQTGNDAVAVITMFYGEAAHGRRPPRLFATMVYGGPRHGECGRYSTWDEAEKRPQGCRRPVSFHSLSNRFRGA